MAFDLGSVLSSHRHDPTRLVQILKDVMEGHGYISPELITNIARALQLPRAHVEGVSGFYSFFSTKDRGRYRVLFSDNITDEMQGSAALRQRMLDNFGLELNEVSRDGLLSIGVTSCTGLCDQGPAMLVNGYPIARLTPARIGAVSSLIRSGSPVSEWPENLMAIDTHIEKTGLLLSDPLKPGEGIKAALERGPEDIIGEVKTSRLRGRGGAGFGTGMKWGACRAAESDERYVVCNADEGEPGTFKDRVLLSHYPDLVIEGMTVAAHAIGAKKGFIYLRGEYKFLGPLVEAVLEARRQANLLGKRICGEPEFDFDIEIHWGAGAYVCGEESALLESLEGKRGIPRNRPPYPVTHGYMNKPTIVNNVETLVAVPYIAKHGGEWLRSVGTEKSSGTKILSVSGDVARPGIYEVPFGTTIQSVLDDAGAEKTLAVQVGGPSGVLVSAAEFERRIAFEDVPSAGAFMVLDETRSIPQLVDNFSRFFAHETCGFCTPCRVGTTLQGQIAARLASGQGSKRDLKDLKHVAKVLQQASHCGLGRTACNPALQALEKFCPSFARNMETMEVMPSFNIDEALAPAREATGREDEGSHWDAQHS